MALRFHAQTGGSTLTAQQPENNIVRVAIQALSAVAGGAQSLHTNGFDEALALPTERSARIALRTQQILAAEAGAIDTADPLGGSYFIEALTDELEERARELIERIDELGGAVAAVEAGCVQRRDRGGGVPLEPAGRVGERVIVGVNALHRGGRAARGAAGGSTRTASAAGSSGRRACAPSGTPRRRRPPSPRCAASPQARRTCCRRCERHSGPRHDRRDLRTSSARSGARSTRSTLDISTFIDILTFMDTLICCAPLAAVHALRRGGGGDRGAVQGARRSRAGAAREPARDRTAARSACAT